MEIATCLKHNLTNRDAGWPVGPADYARLGSPRGAPFDGSRAEITDKIL
jgi:hypothetical protein